MNEKILVECVRCGKKGKVNHDAIFPMKCPQCSGTIRRVPPLLPLESAPIDAVGLSHPLADALAKSAKSVGTIPHWFLGAGFTGGFSSMLAITGDGDMRAVFALVAGLILVGVHVWFLFTVVNWMVAISNGLAVVVRKLETTDKTEVGSE